MFRNLLPKNFNTLTCDITVQAQDRVDSELLKS